MADFGGRYRFVRRLGAGGMGEVWLACDEELGDRLVAIKVMHSRMLADPDDVGRFQREMRLASRMQHPNIMTVFTTGSDNGVPFMVMEYLSGSDLGRLPPGMGADEVARIGRETCSALAYAHGLSPGVVHRDIKPGNLFICDSGQVKVTDFGIAKAVGGTRLSVTGTLIGTLPYIAPEQWLGEPPAFSNDVWAAGCVLYEFLSGRLPRSFETPTDYVTAAARREPISPLPGTVPRWLSDAVLAMLQLDPLSRPAAAQCVQLLSPPTAHSIPVPAIRPFPRAVGSDITVSGYSPRQRAPTQDAQRGISPGRPATHSEGRSPRSGRGRYAGLAAIAAVILAGIYVATQSGSHGAAKGVSATSSAATQPARPGDYAINRQISAASPWTVTLTDIRVTASGQSKFVIKYANTGSTPAQLTCSGDTDPTTATVTLSNSQIIAATATYCSDHPDQTAINIGPGKSLMSYAIFPVTGQLRQPFNFDWSAGPLSGDLNGLQIPG